MVSITYEHIKQGRLWQSYQHRNNGVSITRTWICAFEDSPIQDGLSLCRQFCQNQQENENHYWKARGIKPQVFNS